VEDLNAYLDALGTQVRTNSCSRKFHSMHGHLQFSVFDAPLHFQFKAAGDAGSDFDLRKIWDGTLVQVRPIDTVLVHHYFCCLYSRHCLEL
jgi:alpha-amylase